MRKRTESAEAVIIMRLFNTYDSIHVHQVAHTVGIDKRNARYHLKALHSLGRIYISGYSKEQRGPALPLYSKGKKQDVPYPPRLPYYQKKLNWLRRKESKCLSTLWLTSKPQALEQAVES